MFKSILISTFGHSAVLDKYLEHVSAPDVLGEKHHILPKSIFPDFKNSDWNLVVLSVERHFYAHKLLVNLTVGTAYHHKMVSALNLMLKHKPEKFDYAKHAEHMSVINTGKNNPMFGKHGESNPNFGKPLSFGRRLNISNSLMGDKHPMYGVSKSDEFKNNLSLKRTGMVFSDEHRSNISISKSGENHPMWGKNKTASTKQKISMAVRGEKNGMYGKVLSDNPNSCRVLYDGVIYPTAMEAAKTLGINKCTLGRWFKSGKAVKLDKLIKTP